MSHCTLGCSLRGKTSLVPCAPKVELINQHGRRFVEIAGELKEVVIASASDVSHLPGVNEGIYLVGTGDTGTAATFATLGVGYLFAMMTGAMLQKVPREG